MRTLPVIAGSFAYFAGFQWDFVPESLAGIAVLVAFGMFMTDLCSDPKPNRRQVESLRRLAEKVEPRLYPGTTERMMQQITARPSEIDPKVLLGELLDDEDRKWLQEQVSIIAKEEA